MMQENCKKENETKKPLATCLFLLYVYSFTAVQLRRDRVDSDVAGWMGAGQLLRQDSVEYGERAAYALLARYALLSRFQ